MNVLGKPCSTKYRAAHDSGRRRFPIRYIVLHSTEGATAESAAAWFQNPHSQGSTNLVVDDVACFKCVPDNIVPWGAPPLNEEGFHIEIAGHARWSLAQWMAHHDSITRAAYKASLRMKAHNIPFRFCTPADLKAKRHGITTHMNISAAFHQTDHQDPGHGFPMDLFMEYIRIFISVDL